MHYHIFPRTPPKPYGHFPHQATQHARQSLQTSPTKATPHQNAPAIHTAETRKVFKNLSCLFAKSSLLRYHIFPRTPSKTLRRLSTTGNPTCSAIATDFSNKGNASPKRSCDSYSRDKKGF